MKKEKIDKVSISEIEKKSRILLEKYVFTNDHILPGTTRSIASDILLDSLVWRVLIPIIVTISSGLTVEIVKQKLEQMRSKKPDCKNEEITITGEKLTSEKYMQCFNQVEEVLEHYGTTKKTTEIIITEIIKETKITHKQQ